MVSIKEKPSVLSGVRVLDFGHYIAASILTRMRSDMGAEIIKVELALRGAMQEVPHPGIGPVALPKSPFHFSETTVEIRSRAPLLGEHNERILSQYLGYSADRIASLTQSGVLVQEPLVKEFRERGEIQ